MVGQCVSLARDLEVFPELCSTTEEVCGRVLFCPVCCDHLRYDCCCYFSCFSGREVSGSVTAGRRLLADSDFVGFKLSHRREYFRMGTFVIYEQETVR